MPDWFPNIWGMVRIRNLLSIIFIWDSFLFVCGMWVRRHQILRFVLIHGTHPPFSLKEYSHTSQCFSTALASFIFTAICGYWLTWKPFTCSTKLGIDFSAVDACSLHHTVFILEALFSALWKAFFVFPHLGIFLLKCPLLFYKDPKGIPRCWHIPHPVWKQSLSSVSFKNLWDESQAVLQISLLL